jgi:hypothetical protein
MTKRNILIGVGIVVLAIAWVRIPTGIVVRQQDGERGISRRGGDGFD